MFRSKVGSCVLLIGRAYVSWFWGRRSAWSCCLRCIGGGSCASTRSGWRVGKIILLFVSTE